MCGLAAIIDPYLGDKEREAFWTLLLVTSLRGIDSTGVISVESRYNYQNLKPEVPDKHIVRWVKALGDPFRLRAKSEFSRVLKPLEGYGAKALIGHCRAATRGSLSPENAHPFDVGKLVGIHNGTIRSGLKIPDGETDSQALYEVLQENGISGLKDINGAFALIWYDKETHKVHALRNTERPLFYAEVGSATIIASEKEFIEFTIARSDVFHNKEHTIKMLDPYHLLSVDLADIRMRIGRDIASNVTIEDKTDDCVKKWEVVAGRNGGRFRFGPYSEYYEDWPTEQVEQEGTKATTTTRASTTGLGSDGPQIEGVVGVDDTTNMFPCYPIGAGVYVTRKKYRDLLKCGCSWCTAEATETDPVVWGEETDASKSLQYDQFLCEHCVTGNEEVSSSWAGFDTASALAESKRQVGRILN